MHPNYPCSLLSRSSIWLVSLVAGWYPSRVPDDDPQFKDEAEERLYRSQILQAANFAEEKNYGLATRALLEAPARFRNFEWGYLLRKANPQLTVLEGEVQNIYSLAVSPDGTRLATGSEDTMARIWDAQSGQLLKRLEGHVGVIESVAYSPDGKSPQAPATGLSASGTPSRGKRCWCWRGTTA